MTAKETREMNKKIAAATEYLFARHSNSELARATKIAKSSIAGWKRTGRVSVLGVLALAKANIINRPKTFRPDITDWDRAKLTATNRAKGIAKARQPKAAKTSNGTRKAVKRRAA